MASSEVDQKFLGKIAKAVEKDNPILAQMLFKILGLSLNLAEQLIVAKKQRRPEPTRAHQFFDLVYHIIWLSREGLNMLEQYVIPWVGNNPELMVLAYKLRASFFHIYVLFYNNPPVSTMNIAHSDMLSTLAPLRIDKGKGIATKQDPSAIQAMSRQHDYHGSIEGGPVGPPPGFSTLHHKTPIRPKLIPEGNYLPTAHEYFKTAAKCADRLLWGSHSLRLSVKTEYAAFLYECMHDAEASRKLAHDTIAEVYEAQEGMDDEMFDDACELVAVLGKMKNRGKRGSKHGSSIADNTTPPSRTGSVPPGMENAI